MIIDTEKLKEGIVLHYNSLIKEDERPEFNAAMCDAMDTYLSQLKRLEEFAGKLKAVK